MVDILETTASEDNGDDDETGEEDDDYVFDSDDEEWVAAIIVMFSHVIHVVTRQDHKNKSRYSSHYIPCPLFRGGRYNCFDVLCCME